MAARVTRRLLDIATSPEDVEHAERRGTAQSCLLLSRL